MKAETVDLNQAADALEGLRRELGRLGERVAALEAAVPAVGRRVPDRRRRERGRRPRPQAPAAPGTRPR